MTIVVADLLRWPGQRRHADLGAVLEGLAVVDTRVPEGQPVRVEVVLESLNEGVVVSGTASAPWAGACRRCLGPVRDELRAELMEVFEREPTEGETQPLHGVEIDLEPVVREVVLLALPLAPLCRHDCQGLCPLCGADRNEEPCECAVEVRDPRWAALDELRFDEGG